MSLLSTIMDSASELVDFARRNIDERGMRIEKDGEDAVKLVDKDRGVVLAKFKSVDDMIESYGPKTPDLNYGNADNYIESINPQGIKAEDMINLNMGDMYGMLPRGATKIKSEGGVNYYKDGNDFYATTYNPDVGEEDVIGYHLAKDGASELQVVNEMKGKGIGAELSYQFRKNNPEAPSGGLSEAGERTARKTYDRLKAEGIVGGSAALGLLAASPESEAGVASQFIRLVEEGYPESTARKIISGELPMDEASRVARAREQGKDIDRNLIHRSPVEGILEFESSKSGRMGPAVYATPLDDYGLSFGENQYNLVAENVPATNRQRLELVEQLSRNLLDQGVDPRVAYQQAQVEANDILRSQGYTTVEMTDRKGRVTEVAILDPTNIRDRDRAAFDPDQIGSPNILASAAPVGAVSSLLATEAATPEGQLNPLLAIPAEVGSALNEAVVGTLDFIGPDTVNAVSELIGTDYRMPRLSDQELVKLYTQGGYMDEGYGRDAIRTATGLLSPL